MAFSMSRILQWYVIVIALLCAIAQTAQASGSSGGGCNQSNCPTKPKKECVKVNDDRRLSGGKRDCEVVKRKKTVKCDRRCSDRPKVIGAGCGKKGVKDCRKCFFKKKKLQKKLDKKGKYFPLCSTMEELPRDPYRRHLLDA